MVPRHSVVRVLLLLVLVTTMAACVPGIPAASMVRPTVFSVRLPSVEGDPVRIQGRGFGDGADGTRDDTYLVLGARSDCSGGERVMTETWSASRISFVDPGDVGSGYLCVVVHGVASNGMPVDVN